MKPTNGLLALFLEWLALFVWRLKLLFAYPPNKAAKSEGRSRPTGEDAKPGISVAISSGHGARVPGAIGILNEVREARRVVKRVAKHLREMGVTAHEFHDDDSATQGQNLDAIIGWHNRQKCDMDASVHFNAFMPTDGPMGTEVYYLSDSKAAKNVSKAIAAAGGFRNRGGKLGSFAFLRLTKKPAILIEVCFVDSAEDAVLYETNFDAICRAIAEALAGAA